MRILDRAGSRAWTAELAESHLGDRRWPRSGRRRCWSPGPADELREIALFVVGRDF